MIPTPQAVPILMLDDPEKELRLPDALMREAAGCLAESVRLGRHGPAQDLDGYVIELLRTAVRKA